MARDEGVWLETNSQPERLDLTDHWLMGAKKGEKIVINTDSRNKDSLDCIKLVVITARRDWLEKENVTNTLPSDKLLKLLREKS